MKKTPVLFIGNDINNISNAVSWKNLLEELVVMLDLQGQIDHINEKPFPLLYEEIYLKNLRNKAIAENKIKTFISDQVGQINFNSIHERIIASDAQHIITTNYDYTLQNACEIEDTEIKNLGKVRESKYSIFRKSMMNQCSIWQIHGEKNRPNSICLGYEHYAGYLQNMRNYLATGIKYKALKLAPFSRRMRKNNAKIYSWIDLFFIKDIHIFGLGLSTSEIDIWWLLTYRARLKNESGLKFSNKLFYYYPLNLKDKIRANLELLEACDVHVVGLKAKNKLSYYTKILDNIEAKH